MVEVIDADLRVGLLLERDVEALQSAFLAVGRPVGPRGVGEHEHAQLAQRLR
jgi:hypothetical protein